MAPRQTHTVIQLFDELWQLRHESPSGLRMCALSVLQQFICHKDPYATPQQELQLQQQAELRRITLHPIALAIMNPRFTPLPPLDTLHTMLTQAETMAAMAVTPQLTPLLTVTPPLTANYPQPPAPYDHILGYLPHAAPGQQRTPFLSPQPLQTPLLLHHQPNATLSAITTAPVAASSTSATLQAPLATPLTALPQPRHEALEDTTMATTHNEGHTDPIDDTIMTSSPSTTHGHLDATTERLQNRQTQAITNWPMGRPPTQRELQLGPPPAPVTPSQPELHPQVRYVRPVHDHSHSTQGAQGSLGDAQSMGTTSPLPRALRPTDRITVTHRDELDLRGEDSDNTTAAGRSISPVNTPRQVHDEQGHNSATAQTSTWPQTTSVDMEP